MLLRGSFFKGVLMPELLPVAWDDPISLIEWLVYPLFLGALLWYATRPD